MKVVAHASDFQRRRVLVIENRRQVGVEVSSEGDNDIGSRCLVLKIGWT